MRVALCSDDPYPVHATLQRELEKRGHQVERFGAVASGQEEPWPAVAEAAALAVARGECQMGVLLCWTGTGICMAANKVPGIRAALCGDPGTAAGARTWNHANVLCLSNRTLSDDMAKEILAAWLDTDPGDRGSAGVRMLMELDGRHRR
ncbi:MAG: RpiB/LacA/LacB family sugar-phosphate isomerase [Deltaproteobacteria bacterium]|nr:RpiB/LacA/LacB family sugar-phosphate isomerase [Deltaproteobacteria bacterium]